MKIFGMSLIFFLGVLLSLTISGCSDNDNLVTIQGQVDDGTATSPIANAQCRFVNQNGARLASARANDRGEFRLGVAAEVQGFIGCNPLDFPRLILATFVSTVGLMEGEIIPGQGLEEVSPRTTVIANILAQTTPPNPQARKLELLAALEAQDPDLSMLTGAATALFNALLEEQIDDVTFSDIGGEGGDGSDGSDGDSGDDGGGVGGEAGDGAEFSPFVNVLVEFTLDLTGGDSALEDLLADGTANRRELQSIAAKVQQNAAISEAFARQFPTGLQPLVNGQPLRTLTNATGAYFLPVPPNKAGFITATPAPNLAISTFVRARQPGETLTDQNISPPIQIFTALLLPLLTPQDIPAIQDNFLFDIGNLQEPANGVVRVETRSTPEGEIMADTDEDGIACSFLGGPEAAMIDYSAAAGAAFVATTLFQGLLLEARSPAPASFTPSLGPC